MELSDIRKLNLMFNNKKICDAELQISTQNIIDISYPNGKVCTNPSNIKVSLIGIFANSEEDEVEKEIGYAEIIRIPSEYKEFIYHTHSKDTKKLPCSKQLGKHYDDILEATNQIYLLKDENIVQNLFYNDLYYVSEIVVYPAYRNKCIGEFLLSELPSIIKSIFNETPIITLKAFPIEHRDSANMQKIMMSKLCSFYKKCSFVELENKVFYKY